MEGLIPESKSQHSRVGFIKIGGRKEITNKKGELVSIPESYDYFIATGQYSNYFNKAFGEKPKSIQIMFCSDNFFESFWERYELWSGARRWAYGDGIDFKVYDEKTDKFIDKKKSEITELHKKLNGEWITRLTIKFLMPSTGVLGLWELSTKGKETSIPAMKASFCLVQEIAKSVIGVPFDLNVEKHISYKPKSSNKYPVLQLVSGLGLQHLEKVRDYITNKKFVGLLTENKIDDIAMNEVAKQVEYLPAESKKWKIGE
jgi:hypothetical protein